MHLVWFEWNRQAELNKQGALAVTDRWIPIQFVMKDAGQQSMLSFLSMFAFFSQQLRLWFCVLRHCELQQERDYGLLLGNSLQIACISLDWLYCPCGDVIPVHIGKRAHTWAQVCTHARAPTHPHTNRNLHAALREWTAVVSYLSACCLFRIQLADKARSRSVLLGCLNPASHTPNLGVHFNSISHLPAARMS